MKWVCEMGEGVMVWRLGWRQAERIPVRIMTHVHTCNYMYIVCTHCTSSGIQYMHMYSRCHKNAPSRLRYMVNSAKTVTKR